ncbi:MAG: prepilin-type N-terminal cleavage/methylation domain-containing protein [Gemmatimonadota bacterium]
MRVRSSYQLTRQGVTLIEMLIVVTMISIILAISIPKLNMSRLRAKSAVTSLGTTMLALQREAISKQHNILVLFADTPRQIRVVYDSNSNERWDAGERERPIPLGEEILFGKPTAVTARAFGGNTINFTNTEPTTGLPAIVLYRDGSAKQYGGVYLTTGKAIAGAAGHEGETWAMEMIRATGRPEWYRWNGTTWLRGF